MINIPVTNFAHQSLSRPGDVNSFAQDGIIRTDLFFERLAVCHNVIDQQAPKANVND